MSTRERFYTLCGVPVPPCVTRVEMEARGLKGWYAIKGIFPRLSAALGQHRAAALTPEMLFGHELALRGKGLAPATRQSYFWLLKSAFKLGVRYRRIALIPEFPRLGALKNARRGFVEPEAFCGDPAPSTADWPGD